MRRILVALDTSPRAPAVLAAGLSIANATGGTIRLFRGIPIQPEIPWDMLHTFPPGGLEELLTKRATADLEERARAIPPERLDGIATAIGKPWATIRDAARTWKADLIVIGSHGYDVADHVLGTTAAKVVDHAPCSVLVVR